MQYREKLTEIYPSSQEFGFDIYILRFCDFCWWLVFGVGFLLFFFLVLVAFLNGKAVSVR